ncbi:MAG: hypothetical protein ACUVR8_13785 [Acidobacteriota bacterium]
MTHHCRFDFPAEKCLDMGCEHFYTQVQTRFETISELLLQVPATEFGLHSKLGGELERCLRLLRDFHIMFPECSVSDCLTGTLKHGEIATAGMEVSPYVSVSGKCGDL